ETAMLMVKVCPRLRASALDMLLTTPSTHLEEFGVIRHLSALIAEYSPDQLETWIAGLTPWGRHLAVIPLLPRATTWLDIGKAADSELDIPNRIQALLNLAGSVEDPLVGPLLDDAESVASTLPMPGPTQLQIAMRIRHAHLARSRQLVAEVVRWLEN